MASATVSAQSGGGYNLTWSSVDGGGYTWVEGDGYRLGGAIGQPDAQEPATGGGYSLQGGFWHPVCSPHPVAVSVSCSAPVLTLTWTPDAANKAYDIHRNVTPYFIPGPASLVATVTGGTWQDTNGCGSTGQNYYYVVRATCVGAHADADERGEFDFAIVPGD
jgi:hypothetical protein